MQQKKKNFAATIESRKMKKAIMNIFYRKYNVQDSSDIVKQNTTKIRYFRYF